MTRNLEEQFVEARSRFAESVARILRESDVDDAELQPIFDLLSQQDDVLDEIQDAIGRLES